MELARRSETLMSRQNRRILKLLAAGWTIPEIAADGRVKLSVRTVQYRKKQLRESFEFIQQRVR